MRLLKFEPSKLEDVEFLKSLQAAAMDSNDLKENLPFFFTINPYTEHTLVLVDELTNTIAGVLGWSSSCLHRKSAKLEFIGTHSQYYKQGLAKKLLNSLFLELKGQELQITKLTEKGKYLIKTYAELSTVYDVKITGSNSLDTFDLEYAKNIVLSN